LAAPEVALIHGPPGTGKTTALVELIAQLCGRDLRVLACAASNVAVDNLLERVRQQVPKMRAVRLGHPARLSPAVLECCLDACVARADSSALASDIRAEMKSLSARLLKLGAHKDRAERKDTRRQLSQLAREERTRTAAAVKEVVAGAQLVAATLTGALSRTMDAAGTFDVIVIDEAAQALEAACWGALLKGRRAVLAGDHLQLPPTVLSEAAARAGLGRTLFERAHAAHPQLCRMLTVQYRMAGAISDWASGELYGSRLTAPGAVADRTLSNMAIAQPSLASVPVLLLCDTAGCECEESDSGESKSNDGEARVAMAHALRLVAAGLPASAIGVITPYSAQVTLLRQMRADSPLLAALEVSTVDGFQGREKEAVIITCVRSNPRHEVGFLADARRMNVAVTRARRHVCIICDTETLGRDAFLKRIGAWFEAHGEVRSAAELL
jgi:ATP-dependent RNA/DNA helicase IGHMBP2